MWGYLQSMAKKEMIDRGSTRGYILRTETGRFVTKDGVRSCQPVATKEKPGKGETIRSSSSGRFTVLKNAKSVSSPGIRSAYSMPNGDKIVTVRRDIIDHALGRKK